MQRTEVFNEQKIESIMTRKKRYRSINSANPHGNKNYKIVEKSDEFFKNGYLIPGSSAFKQHTKVNLLQNYSFRKAKLLAKNDDIKYDKSNSTG